MFDRKEYKKKVDQLIAKFSRRYGEKAKAAADKVLELIEEGMPVRQAVDKALAATNFFPFLNNSLTEALLYAAAYGYGLLPKMVANPTGLTKRLLNHSWTPDKMKLSTRLHGANLKMRQRIIESIISSMKQQKSFVGLARDLYDGYNYGKIINRAELAKYLDNLQQLARRVAGRDQTAYYQFRAALNKAKKQVERLAENGAPTKALKVAYQILVEEAGVLNEQALDKAVKVAIEEKSRYYAERIARTEIARAYTEGFMLKIKADSQVVAIRWVLGSRHPKTDICDFYAQADLYGLGPGVYPKDRFPPMPAHPHCGCHPVEVYEREGSGIFNIKNGDRYLRELDEAERRNYLGVEGERAWRRGEDWRKHLRGWREPENLQVRINLPLFNS